MVGNSSQGSTGWLSQGVAGCLGWLWLGALGGSGETGQSGEAQTVHEWHGVLGFYLIGRGKCKNFKEQSDKGCICIWKIIILGWISRKG